MGLFKWKGLVPWRILMVYFMLSVSQELPVGAFSAIMYKEMNLSPTKVMSYYMLCYTPWLLRPVYGFISDQFPIFRYRRKPYLTLHSAFSVAVFVCLSLFGDQFSIFQILSVANAGLIAFCEVMVDGLAVELSNKLKRELEERDRNKGNVPVPNATSSEDKSPADLSSLRIQTDSPTVPHMQSNSLEQETKLDVPLASRLAVQTQGSTNEIFQVVGGIDDVTHVSTRELMGKTRGSTDAPSVEIFAPAQSDFTRHSRSRKLAVVPALVGTGEAVVRSVGESTLLTLASKAWNGLKGCCCSRKTKTRTMRRRKFLRKPRSMELPLSPSQNLPRGPSAVAPTVGTTSAPLPTPEDEEALLFPSYAESCSYGSAQGLASIDATHDDVFEIVDDGSAPLPPDDELYTYKCISEEFFDEEIQDSTEKGSTDPMKEATPETICALVQAECMFVRSSASLVAAALSVLAMYCLPPRKVLLVTAISPLVTALFSFFIPDQRVSSTGFHSTSHTAPRAASTTTAVTMPTESPDATSSNKLLWRCNQDSEVDTPATENDDGGTQNFVNQDEEGCCMEMLLTHHVAHPAKTSATSSQSTSQPKAPCRDARCLPRNSATPISPQVMTARGRGHDYGPGPLGRRSSTSTPSTPLTSNILTSTSYSTYSSPGSRSQRRLSEDQRDPVVEYPSLLGSARASSSAALLSIVSPTAALTRKREESKSTTVLDAHRTIRKVSTASPSQQLAYLRELHGPESLGPSAPVHSDHFTYSETHVTSSDPYQPPLQPNRTEASPRQHIHHSHATDAEIPAQLEGHVGRLHGGQTVLLLPDCTERDIQEHPDDESRWQVGQTSIWSRHEGQKCSCGKVDDEMGAFAGHESLCALVFCVVKQRLILLIRALLLLIQPMLFVFIVYSMPSASTPYESFLYKKFSFENWFLTMLSYFSLLGGLLGSFIYWRILAKRSLPAVFCLTTFLSVLLATPVQYLISRGDLKHTVGIPATIFLPITSFMTAIVTRIALMPTIVLAATNCPAHLGLESTMFSLFSSVSHAASFVSYWFSVEVTHAFHITEKNYNELPYLVLLCNGLSLVPLLFLPLVIPGCIPLPSLPKALRIAGIDDDTGVLSELDRLERARSQGSKESQTSTSSRNCDRPISFDNNIFRGNSSDLGTLDASHARPHLAPAIKSL